MVLLGFKHGADKAALRYLGHKGLESQKRQHQDQRQAKNRPGRTRDCSPYIVFALTGFSKAGLIDQLSSPAGDGYSKADATFAANHVDVDWNAEAVEAAKDYLEISSFSEQALIDQLSSSAGDQFTPAQARYAVNKVY